jgi:hypothetical protein
MHHCEFAQVFFSKLEFAKDLMQVFRFVRTTHTDPVILELILCK